jgi:hypothetical protein
MDPRAGSFLSPKLSLLKLQSLVIGPPSSLYKNLKIRISRGTCTTLVVRVPPILPRHFASVMEPIKANVKTYGSRLVPAYMSDFFDVVIARVTT